MSKSLFFSLISLLFCFTLALFVPLFSPYEANLSDLSSVKLPPSFNHFFGTDLLGRDLFLRCAKALQVSFLVGFLASFLALTLGIGFAFLAQLFARNFFLALFDALLALPALLVAMFVASVMGGNLSLTILVLGFGHFAFIAKVLDSEFELLKKSDFYLCAIVLGNTRLKILFFELLPACLHIIGVVFILNIAHAISGEASLSFFGLGVPLGEASLGNLLSEGAKALFLGAWWLILYPVALILALILPLLHLGLVLQDKFGVKL